MAKIPTDFLLTRNLKAHPEKVSFKKNISKDQRMIFLLITKPSASSTQTT